MIPLPEPVWIPIWNSRPPTKALLTVIVVALVEVVTP